ncbi:HpcH/HpaI aldolase/citrate lyase family protein [Rhodococcus sp. X156]|uniref:HpcH/HpaI aldolase/citrate lyase family protein n=1 Tax=Rhodococcus sp. X156 TaxID=2499145 RepID=UPI000FDA6B2B|nr:HpcH/HpaI aldolase/citrate lyase family protein [Rhodococcus sp. X156]
MIHFDFLAEDVRASLFSKPPQPVTADSPHDLLATHLGATLYCPATRPNLARDVVRSRAAGVTSMVLCLEDSVANTELAAAEQNLVDQLVALQADTAPRPRLFVRVRTAEQIGDLVRRLGPATTLLSGFVLPKFTVHNGAGYLQALAQASSDSGVRLWAMPVIESADVLYLETRAQALAGIRALLNQAREQVLAVRLGASDFSGVFGLRRTAEMTIYDVRLVGNAIADVVNVLGRADGTGFTITGPVWEYFTGGERIFKPQLRASVFAEHGAQELRSALLRHDLDGLIREVQLDKVNGLTGKTVIHPSHVTAVHALSVVTHEEFADANDVLAATSPGGVLRSEYGNKMNEVNPHRAWAHKVQLRAAAFGVAAEDVSYVELLTASDAA